MTETPLDRARRAKALALIEPARALVVAKEMMQGEENNLELCPQFADILLLAGDDAAGAADLVLQPGRGVVQGRLVAFSRGLRPLPL